MYVCIVCVYVLYCVVCKSNMLKFCTVVEKEKITEEDPHYVCLIYLTCFAMKDYGSSLCSSYKNPAAVLIAALLWFTFLCSQVKIFLIMSCDVKLPHH